MNNFLKFVFGSGIVGMFSNNNTGILMREYA